MKHITSSVSILCLLIFISSCSSFSPYQVPVLQGNIFEEKDLDKLVEGLTKDQVQFILGSALIKDPFRKSRWDYYNSVTIGEEVVTESKLIINFNEEGLLESWVVEKLAEEN